MKKFLLVLLLSVVSHLVSMGQKAGVYMGMQYGSFSMQGLSEFQNDLPLFLDLPLENLESFPNYTGFEIGANCNISEKYRLDFYYNYISTGSRSYYEDYSGQVYFDQIVKGNSVGVHNRIKLNKMSNFHVMAGLRTGLTFSKLESEYFLKLEGISSPTREKFQFNSTNLHFSPSLLLQKNIGRFFILAEGRYEFHVAGKLKSQVDKDMYLVNLKSEPVRADWDGFRMLLAAGIVF